MIENEGILSMAGVADVCQALAHDGDHMVIIQAVIDALALPPGLDQVCIAQQPQLVGNRRLTHSSCSSRAAMMRRRLLSEKILNTSLSRSSSGSVGSWARGDRHSGWEERDMAIPFYIKRIGEVRPQTVQGGCGRSGTGTAGRFRHRAAAPPAAPGDT